MLKLKSQTIPGVVRRFDGYEIEAHRAFSCGEIVSLLFVDDSALSIESVSRGVARGARRGGTAGLHPARHAHRRGGDPLSGVATGWGRGVGELLNLNIQPAP